MEVALNSVIAPSTHKFTLLDGRYPTLLENNNSLCNKKINTANNGVSQSILNFFGSPQKCSYNGDLTSNDVYTLESITLKNALNMNNNKNDKIDVHQLIENQKSQYKLLQCNNTELPLKSQQPKTLITTTTDLLAALKITNTTTKTVKNRQNSLNASNLSTSPSSTPLSTTLTVDTLSTTNSSTSSTLKAVSTGTPLVCNNSVVSKVTKNGLQIPSDILDDLASRFIINNPDMELSNFIRICFQIELAHWFYLDFFCAAEGDQPHHEELRKRKLPTCGMKQFAIQIFRHIPFLREHLSSIDKILDDWKNYKLSVPTFGAILISEDLNFCLLVQSYFAKCSWGFPKGKVNENEDPVHCATREVYEETGYDITKLIVPNDYIEAVINYQYTRLYIVRDVSLDTQFSPRTRNEIKCCDWFPIDSLPVNKNDAISKAKLGINANSFFMIIPFVKRLKKWVNDKRAGIETRRKFSGDGRSSSTESMNSPTSQLPALTAATGTTPGGSNQNSNNQKQTNVNNSSKKNKQHTNNNNNDDKHKAANNNGGNNNGVNATPTSTNKNNNNRSKRQRHKSMGDLDCNTNNGYKNSIYATAVSDGVESSTESTVKIGDSGNCRTVSNHKRNGSSAKQLAAGSNNNSAYNHNNGAGCTSSKRQLFHSQSQNGCNQSGEKIVSSFDLIRKERQQQLKAAAQAEKAAKAQKQQQQQQQQQQLQGNANCNNSGRVRAKSQGDKMCIPQQQQQQQQQQHTNKNNNTNNTGGNNKHRVQKQLSMIIVNSNATANNDNNKSNHNNNIATHNTATQNTIRVASSPTPTASNSSGAELLAFAAKTAAAPSMSAVTHTAQKPRPASAATPVAGHTATNQLQHMASATNLRILKRSTSDQPQTEQQQMQIKQSQYEQNNVQVQRQQQAQLLQFTPRFNSWTNFSFTKNFISNVFC